MFENIFRKKNPIETPQELVSHKISSSIINFSEDDIKELQSFKILSYNDGKNPIYFLLRNNEPYILKFLFSYEEYLKKQQGIIMRDSSYESIEGKISILVGSIYNIDSLLKYCYSGDITNSDNLIKKLKEGYLQLNRNCIEYLGGITKEREFLILEDKFHSNLRKLLESPDEVHFKEFFKSYYIKDSFFTVFSVNKIAFNSGELFSDSKIIFKLAEKVDETYLSLKSKLKQKDLFRISKDLFIKYSVYKELNNNFSYNKKKDATYEEEYAPLEEILFFINQQKISNSYLYFNFFNSFLSIYLMDNKFEFDKTKDKTNIFTKDSLKQEEGVLENKRNKKDILKIKEVLFKIKNITQYVYNKKYSKPAYIAEYPGFEPLRRKLKYFSYSRLMKIFISNVKEDIKKNNYLNSATYQKIYTEMNSYLKFVKKDIEPLLPGNDFSLGVVKNIRLFTENKEVYKLIYELVYNSFKDGKLKEELFINSKRVEEELVSYWETIKEEQFVFFSSIDFGVENLGILRELNEKVKR